MKSYNVGELRRLKENSEFKPVLGPGVEADNKRNNEKSYKDSEKRAKDYDGGLQDAPKKKLQPKVDGNKTTLDYTPVNEPDETYKKRVRAQAKGYTSELEEKNGIEKADQYDNDGKILKQFTDARDERLKLKKKIERSGLQGQNLPEKEKHTLSETELPKPKRLTFKNTTFLNEQQMLSRIPEHYKKDGQKIYMCDASKNEYIVECVKSEKMGIIETNVIGYKNQAKDADQLKRVFQLMEYSTPNKRAALNERVNADDNFTKMMNKARGLEKK